VGVGILTAGAVGCDTADGTGMCGAAIAIKVGFIGRGATVGGGGALSA
jgi:hypothetical protein